MFTGLLMQVLPWTLLAASVFGGICVVYIRRLRRLNAQLQTQFDQLKDAYEQNMQALQEYKKAYDDYRRMYEEATQREIVQRELRKEKEKTVAQIETKDSDTFSQEEVDALKNMMKKGKGSK